MRDLIAVQMIFYHPIRRSRFLTDAQISSIFANLDEIIELNNHLYERLRQRQQEFQYVVEAIGDIFLAEFHKFEIYATFCGNHQRALEELDAQRRASLDFDRFIREQESNPRCHRLSLKDFLAMPMQRLTKYPLLLSTILSCTPRSHADHTSLLQAVSLVKEVVTHVNECVKRRQNAAVLSGIQAQLDTHLLGYVRPGARVCGHSGDDCGGGDG